MKQLQAIIPIYVDNIGNAVQLYFNYFTTTSYCSLDCCIKKIARNQLIDITEAKKLIKKSLNITKNPPICFKNGTYCMIKVRKPITKKRWKLRTIQHRHHRKNRKRSAHTKKQRENHNTRIQEKHRRQNSKSKTRKTLDRRLHDKLGHTHQIIITKKTDTSRISFSH